MNDLLISILSSIGGTTVILGGLFGWLGRRYLDRILESERASNKERLAGIQNELSKEFEIHKFKIKNEERFFENQFEASFKLFSIMKDILPEKGSPEMNGMTHARTLLEILRTFKRFYPSFLKRITQLFLLQSMNFSKKQNMSALTGNWKFMA